METRLVRLKPHDPRRGHVLRRFSYQGIKFHDDRGWYRVEKSVADYLGKVHQVPGEGHTPLAFDVCTPKEAEALDENEKKEASPRKSATDDIQVSVGRAEDTLTSSALSAAPPADAAKGAGRRTKKA